jgi:hypothetical protein
VFLKFGGSTGTSTQEQRDAAYLLAEEQMVEHLSSFLIPTIITGSIFWKYQNVFDAEFGNILNVISVSVESIKQLNPLQTQIYTGSALVRNSAYGYVDVFTPCNYYGSIYSATMVYESGLGSGTVTSPTMLSALTLAAQINLNEWDVSLSNEGVADVGIESFSNQSYSEKRKYLGRTVFGNSAMAQRVAMLTRKYRAKPSIGFR